MQIADNHIAQAYDHLQKSIDWHNADYDSQLNIMYTMKSLLIGARSFEPIFDYGGVNMLTGARNVQTASERLDIVMRRIARIEKERELS